MPRREILTGFSERKSKYTTGKCQNSSTGYEKGLENPEKQGSKRYSRSPRFERIERGL